MASCHGCIVDERPKNILCCIWDRGSSKITMKNMDEILESGAKCGGGAISKRKDINDWVKGR